MSAGNIFVNPRKKAFSIICKKRKEIIKVGSIIYSVILANHNIRTVQL